MTRRLSLLAVVPVAAALLIAGCGGGSSNSNAGSANAASTSTPGPAAGGQVIKVSADPSGQLRFNMTKLTAKPGKVTLEMANPMSAGMAHGISVEGNGVDKDGPIVAAGKTSTVTVTLKKGTYEFYCPVPGHKQAGMEGTLTVS